MRTRLGFGLGLKFYPKPKIALKTHKALRFEIDANHICYPQDFGLYQHWRYAPAHNLIPQFPSFFDFGLI